LILSSAKPQPRVSDCHGRPEGGFRACRDCFGYRHLFTLLLALLSCSLAINNQRQNGRDKFADRTGVHALWRRSQAPTARRTPVLNMRLKHLRIGEFCRPFAKRRQGDERGGELRIENGLMKLDWLNQSS